MRDALQAGLIAGAVMLAGCGSRSGPGDIDGLLTPLTVAPPPIYALIGSRSELELTSSQVAALDSIAVAVQALNRPLIDQLGEVSPGGTGRPRRVTPEGEPILAEIRANTRRAAEGVAGILTERQRTEVCTLFEPEDDNRRRPPRPTPRDSTRAVTGPPGAWYWCAPESPASSAPPQAGNF